MIRQLLTFRVSYNEIAQEVIEAHRTKDAFYPLDGTGPFDVTKPPNPQLEHPYIEHYAGVLATFHLLPENLEALETILSLNTAATRVVLVEMPVPDTFHAFFGNGIQDYRLFVETIAQRASAQNVPFWRMQDLALLPGPVWYNYNHLNADGAPIFSRWLGKKLAQSSEPRTGQQP